MTRIFVVGSGVVGTATGHGLRAAGHEVTFVDIHEPRVAALRDEGLDARMTLSLEGEPPSVVFLTVPTPAAEHGHELGAVIEAARSAGRALAGSPERHLVAVRSTVPPGTTEGLVQPILERESGLRAHEGFLLACNPEFLRAATARRDFLQPWMTVVASRSPEALDLLRTLLAPFGGELRAFPDPALAELVKCVHNCFNAAKISFWNEVWLVARRLGLDPADVSAVSDTVSRSAEASFNPLYGIRGGVPYGGACLPKDTRAFLAFAEQSGATMALLRAVIAVNDRIAGETAAGPEGERHERPAERHERAAELAALGHEG
ncbi:2-dehydropantoate 2-reductase N-terminal domain-containing protein [Bailinhaonella thermotolerans]|uniref:UDP-glucose 6-dehydrogenase n=1 Tax=Bailinhaonella thermotolerans TaxID=1070861 RepID=A0A3A4AUA6_9ACTN|nr:2-dehydropantoate 2-reductase N-terminal domain-containing protein [Bailinhaonella thermotolerans]RJL33145.1 UDP-glucose/GDP-mannose dehydrogenase family protein [Bailinhaonella thermotolerans]